MKMHYLRGIVMTAATFVFLGAGCFGGAASTKSPDAGVWQSADAGKTWTAKNAMLVTSGTGSIASVDAFSLTFDPQSPSTMYLGTRQNGLFFSLDGGSSWERPQDATLRSGTVVDVAVSSKDVCTYYVLKINRLVKTSNCGRSFTEAYIVATSNVLLSALAIDWYNPSTLWMATTAGDVLKSDDAGVTWKASARVSDNVTTIMVSHADSRVILVGTNRNGMYRTSDGGANWVSEKKDLSTYNKANVVGDFDQTKDGGVIIARTDYGLFTSKDQGASWTPLVLLTGKGEVAIRAVAIHPTDPQQIMYATDTTFYSTSSGGTTWATQELPTAKSAAILQNDPATPAKIWLGLQTIAK